VHRAESISKREQSVDIKKEIFESTRRKQYAEKREQLTNKKAITNMVQILLPLLEVISLVLVVVIDVPVDNCGIRRGFIGGAPGVRPLSLRC
jgi:hypothetical protein